MSEQKDDRYSHPERWTFEGSQVVHIWPDPISGHLVIAWRPKSAPTKGVLSCICADENPALLYREPSVWEGKEDYRLRVELWENGIVIARPLFDDLGRGIILEGRNAVERAGARPISVRTFRAVPNSASERDA